MHLQRVGFGFGWLYSFHDHSVFGFPSASCFFFSRPTIMCETNPQKNVGFGASFFYSSDFVSILGRLLYFRRWL